MPPPHEGETALASTITVAPYDLKNAISENRLKGMGRLMHGYRLPYLGATTSLALSALSKTATYMLLRYFVDNIIDQQDAAHLLPWIALGFVALAVMEGSFTYISGRLAAFTAEGITLRLRNYLFDHIQRLTFSYHSKTQLQASWRVMMEQTLLPCSG